jgi:hypothetical protein
MMLRLGEFPLSRGAAPGFENGCLKQLATISGISAWLMNSLVLLSCQ